MVTGTVCTQSATLHTRCHAVVRSFVPFSPRVPLTPCTHAIFAGKQRRGVTRCGAIGSAGWLCSCGSVVVLALSRPVVVLIRAHVPVVSSLFAHSLHTHAFLHSSRRPTRHSSEKRFRMVVCLFCLFCLFCLYCLYCLYCLFYLYRLYCLLFSLLFLFLYRLFCLNCVFFRLFRLFRLYRLFFCLLTSSSVYFPPSLPSLSSPSPPTRQPLLACRYGIVTVGHVLPLLSCPIFPNLRPIFARTPHPTRCHCTNTFIEQILHNNTRVHVRRAPENHQNKQS